MVVAVPASTKCYCVARGLTRWALLACGIACLLSLTVLMFLNLERGHVRAYVTMALSESAWQAASEFVLARLMGGEQVQTIALTAAIAVITDVIRRMFNKGQPDRNSTDTLAASRGSRLARWGLSLCFWAAVLPTSYSLLRIAGWVLSRVPQWLDGTAGFFSSMRISIGLLVITNELPAAVACLLVVLSAIWLRRMIQQMALGI